MNPVCVTALAFFSPVRKDGKDNTRAECEWHEGVPHLDARRKRRRPKAYRLAACCMQPMEWRGTGGGYLSALRRLLFDAFELLRGGLEELEGKAEGSFHCFEVCSALATGPPESFLASKFGFEIRHQPRH